LVGIIILTWGGIHTVFGDGTTNFGVGMTHFGDGIDGIGIIIVPLWYIQKNLQDMKGDNLSGLDRVEITNTEVMITYIPGHLNLVEYKIG
jgi:hypothetical protein